MADDTLTRAELTEAVYEEDVDVGSKMSLLSRPFLFLPQ